MSSPGPTREQGDLADMVEMLLDKGVVINADIAVSIGDTELLGVQVRAALASFETAAEYGLEFPEGTDVERVEAAASGRSRRQVEDEPSGGDGRGDGEGAASADDDDGDATPEPESPNHVAVRPHATAGGDDEDSVDDGEDDDATD